MNVSQAMSCTPAMAKAIQHWITKESRFRLTFMGLVHELEKLVDNGLEEFPMRLQETRVLPDDIHDVGGANGLVVLAALLFGETQKLLDHADQKSLLDLLACKTDSRIISYKSARGHFRALNPLIAPEIDPIAQHNVFRLFQDHSLPSICWIRPSAMFLYRGIER